MTTTKNTRSFVKNRSLWNFYFFACQNDDTGSIGKLYRRQDEVGTLWCVTVDFDTIEGDGCVTVRDRDTMEQVKVPAEGVKKYIQDKLFE